MTGWFIFIVMVYVRYYWKKEKNERKKSAGLFKDNGAAADAQVPGHSLTFSGEQKKNRPLLIRQGFVVALALGDNHIGPVEYI
jgi:hypothetical protein